MISLISRGRQAVSAIVLSAAAVFAASVQANDIAVDKVANAHGVADCMTASVKDAFKQAIANMDTQSPESPQVIAGRAAMVNINRCVSEVANVPLAELPTVTITEIKTEEDLMALQAQLEAQDVAISKYVDRDTYISDMQSKQSEIVEFIQGEMKKKAALAPQI